MSTKDSSESQFLTLQDFTNSGWKEAISNITHVRYATISESLGIASRHALEKEERKRSKVLRLIADVTSTRLFPQNHNEPFKPLITLNDRRTSIPDDLTQSEISFLAEIVDEVDNAWLKSRIYDVLWLMGEPRNVDFALKAIDAYISIAIDKSTWNSDVEDCWRRAISLSKLLGKKADNRLTQIEGIIIDAFNSTHLNNDYLGLRLANILRSNQMGFSHRTNIAAQLETVAHACQKTNDFHKARLYFNGALEWYSELKNTQKNHTITINIAESFISELNHRLSAGTASQIVAIHFYEKAIQTYRSIPNSKRSTYQINERINQLRHLLNDSTQQSNKEMYEFRTDNFDITRIVENVRTTIAEKPIIDALIIFANICDGINTDHLRTLTLDIINEYPLTALFGSKIISPDGRVAAKRPGMNLNNGVTENNEIAIRAKMIQFYGIFIGITVQSKILPALDVLHLEHRVREEDFIALAKYSSIVPIERANIFGKALFAGYERDFITALHLLIPQIENMIRVHLKQNGVITTHLDKDGIENEYGMSTLLDMPESETIFGKNIHYEFKSLFCDTFGPNLRNVIAHGLLEDDELNSSYAVYAWWLALRLTINTWWVYYKQGTTHKQE